MHDAVNERLSEYLDDELSADERARVEAHLQSCAPCRADLDGLRAVVARARTLADAPPETELWPGVLERIAATVAQPAQRATKRFSFTLPQLVAASLALMVLSGSMVWLARLGDARTDIPPLAAAPGPDADPVVSVNFADAAYDDAIADLERTLEAGRARLDPETVRILDENLQAIDRAIAQCREALKTDPANVYLNRHLSSSRGRKLDLLRRATAILDRSD
jgi:hypothetical protein